MPGRNMFFKETQKPFCIEHTLRFMYGETQGNLSGFWWRMIRTSSNWETFLLSKSA